MAVMNIPNSCFLTLKASRNDIIYVNRGIKYPSNAILVANILYHVACMSVKQKE